MESKELKQFITTWKRNQSRKFNKAVLAEAERIATPIANKMFIEMVKELDNAYTRLGLKR